MKPLKEVTRKQQLTRAHSPYFAQHYRNIYIFSSISSEKKNSPFTRQSHNSCKGWALVKPRLSKFSMGHVLWMSCTCFLVCNKGLQQGCNKRVQQVRNKGWLLRNNRGNKGATRGVPHF